ncbi:hypothetical protein FRB99_002235 [Tulasnella sp. 403]|nr:hypothetical protein FRB99_002235 [Tulasnella sp. 403]
MHLHFKGLGFNFLNITSAIEAITEVFSKVKELCRPQRSQGRRSRQDILDDDEICERLALLIYAYGYLVCDLLEETGGGRSDEPQKVKIALEAVATFEQTLEALKQYICLDETVNWLSRLTSVNEMEARTNEVFKSGQEQFKACVAHHISYFRTKSLGNTRSGRLAPLLASTPGLSTNLAFFR